ncbi:MAG: DeoR family transcriptional regulator [Parcubacteria group bacterium]
MAATQTYIAAITESECRAVRLVQMRDLFLAGETYTVEELVERFGVGRKTIYRDLNSLSRKLCLPLVCEVRWGLMRK